MNKEFCFKYVVRTEATTSREVEAIETMSWKGYLQIGNDAEYKGYVF